MIFWVGPVHPVCRKQEYNTCVLILFPTRLPGTSSLIMRHWPESDDTDSISVVCLSFYKYSTWLKYHFTSSTCQELNMGPHGLGEPTGHLICSEVSLHMWKDLFRTGVKLNVATIKSSKLLRFNRGTMMIIASLPIHLINRSSSYHNKHTRIPAVAPA